MTLKNYKKSEEELTCCFKTDISNLMNFDSSTGKSQKLHLIRLLLLTFELEKYRGVYFMMLESDAKFEEKVTRG